MSRGYERETAAKIGLLKKNQLDIVIANAFNSARTLRNYVQEYPALDHYEEILKRLFKAHQNLDAVELSRGGVITDVFPYEENKKAIGFDILGDPVQQREAIAAVRKGNIIFAGPLNLVQGGVGVVGRLPIYTQKNDTPSFWGFSLVMIRLERLLNDPSITSLSELGYDYQFAKVRTDGTEDIFYRTDSTLIDPVKVEIDLYDNKWVLSLAPTEGWSAFSKTLPFGAVSILLSMIGGIFAWYVARQPYRLTVLVRKTFAELVESEERFRATFEQAPVGIAHLSPDGTFLRVNRTLCSILGRPREELLSTPFADTSHPDEAEADLAALQQLLHGSRTEYVAEKRCRRKTGEFFWAQLSITLLRDAKKSPLYFVVIFQDISERKNFEEQLRHAHENLLSIVDTPAAAVFDLTLDGTVRSIWNKTAERMFGYTKEEVIGRRLPIVPPSRQKEFDTISGRVKNGEMINNFEAQRIGKNGKRIFVSVNSAPLHNASGDVEAIISVLIDITQKKKIEEQFLRAQRIESIGTLAGGIAHDLNNIFSPILLSAQFLKKELGSTGIVGSTLSIIEQGAVRGSAVVKQILNFGRSGSTAERYPVQLKHLVRELESLITETFPSSITVRSEIPNEVWFVNGNVTLLHQALVNLCINARDAMAEGGTLTITLTNRVIDEMFSRFEQTVRPGHYVHISIADTGVGIPKDLLHSMFVPIDSPDAPVAGAGVGLSTAIAIIKQHGGSIFAVSEPNVRTECSIYLPAIESAVSAESVPVPPRGNGEHILVIDVEKPITDIVKQTLEGNGYVVSTANDGAEAITVFDGVKHSVSLVITDLDLPVMDGATTALTISKMSSRVRFIFSSGIAQRDRLRSITHVPIGGFLTKPYSAETLLATVQQVLNTP